MSIQYKYVKKDASWDDLNSLVNDIFSAWHWYDVQEIDFEILQLKINDGNFHNSCPDVTETNVMGTLSVVHNTDAN